MPVIIKDKHSGALIFDKSSTEKKIEEMENRINELEKSAKIKRTPIKQDKEMR